VPAAVGITTDLDPDANSVVLAMEVLEKVTLWLVLSLFVQVTVAPGDTTMAAGLNAKFCIVTDVVAIGCAGVVGVVGVESPPPPPPHPIIATARLNKSRRVRMS
jgi:hypothetical protein